MKNPLLKRAAQKGQAIVLVAVLMVVLIASLGLAIDGGEMFFLYRDMQNATDAAALSAAFALCSDGDPVSAGKRNASLNGWVDDAAEDPNVYPNVVIENPPLSGSFAGDDDYIRVYIEDEKPSYFIQVVYPGPLVVSAESTAQCDPGFSAPWPAGSAIITLGPGCAAGNGNQANVRTTGGGNLTTVNGGITSNSSGCTNGALQAAGGASITAGGYGACSQGGSYETEGGGSITGNQSTSCSTPPITDPDPFFNNGILTKPTCPSLGNGTGVLDTTYHPITNPTATSSPGTYTNFDVGSNKQAFLEPGIYCITASSVSWAGRLTMDTNGAGVFLFFDGTEGATVGAQGSTNLVGISNSSSAYNGFVIWMHEDAGPLTDVNNPWSGYSITNNSELEVTAGAGATIRGTVYAPTKHCNLAGGDEDSTIYGQFICYSFDANGGGNMTIVYEDAAIADDPATFGVTE